MRGNWYLIMSQYVLPKVGTAKVYYKNLSKILNELSNLHPLLHDVRFKNLLLLANEALHNLQKTDPDFDTSALRKELDGYKNIFTKDN